MGPPRPSARGATSTPRGSAPLVPGLAVRRRPPAQSPVFDSRRRAPTAQCPCTDDDQLRVADDVSSLQCQPFPPTSECIRRAKLNIVAPPDGGRGAANGRAPRYNAPSSRMTREREWPSSCSCETGCTTILGRRLARCVTSVLNRATSPVVENLVRAPAEHTHNERRASKLHGWSKQVAGRSAGHAGATLSHCVGLGGGCRFQCLQRLRREYRSRKSTLNVPRRSPGQSVMSRGAFEVTQCHLPFERTSREVRLPRLPRFPLEPVWVLGSEQVLLVEPDFQFSRRSRACPRARTARVGPVRGAW